MEIRMTDKNSQLENSASNSHFCESHGSGSSFGGACALKQKMPWGHQIRGEGTRPIFLPYI